MTKWKENETLVVTINIAQQGSKIIGRYGISFSDDVNFEKLPRGKPVELGDDTFFVIVPTLSWNEIHRTLKKISLSEEDQHQFTRFRAYQIPISNMIWREFPGKGIMISLKMTFGFDREQYDLIDTVRWGVREVDPETHPFIIVTVDCWNNFQNLADRLGIKEQIRESHPMAIPVKKSRDVFRVTQEKFAEMRNTYNQEK